MTSGEAEHVMAGVGYIKGQYGGRLPRPYADGAAVATVDAYLSGADSVVHGELAQKLAVLGRAEFVCTYCERGQCARCRDRACTCCYGGDD